MKRIAQAVNTQYDDAVEQSVMLSPRTLLTGPRQIVRLERQYRSLSEDLQNALENLNRTKESYVNALQTFEQAEEYIRQLGSSVKMAFTLLNNARTNPQNLAQAENVINEIVGAGLGPKNASNNNSLIKTAYSTDAVAAGIAAGGQIGAGSNVATNTSTGLTTPTQTPNAQEQHLVMQQIGELQRRLSTFVNEMHRRYNIHKQRAAAMESQYSMSKSAYAKVRTQFLQMQTEISSLTANLSGWNERLSEYYAPSGGEA